MWSVRAIVSTIALLAAFGLSVGPASAGYLAPTPPPKVAQSEVSAAAERLDRSSSLALLVTSCRTIQAAMYAEPGRAPELDAAVASLRRFAFSKKDAFERFWCLRGLDAELEVTMCYSDRCVSGPKTYVPELHELFRALFASSDATTRIVGAEAARQSSDPADSRIMLDHALHDPSAAVRAKMLENAAIPLLDGSANAADRSLVRRAIAAGLRDASADVNAEALAGEMFVRRGHADDVLRRFAVSGDPLRRAAARLAMLHSMFRSRYAVHMIEAGFTDPDARVRFAAMDAFQQPTPTAIARLKIMAAHAPTKAERDFARSQLQPSGW